MEDNPRHEGKWKEMPNDILVKIFQSLDIFELTSGIADVCPTWHSAASDPLLWRTLDLSVLKSNFIKTTAHPYVYVDNPSDKRLMQVLENALNLSERNISTIVFHFNLYVSDYQLTYTAERCPLVKRLVMPAWNRIEETGICKAISMWKNLESLTMPSISDRPYLMKEIADNCKNFSELKVMGPFDNTSASKLVEHLQTLKVLSLRCSKIWKDALIKILDKLPNLEVLNISHCLLLECPPRAPERFAREIDKSIFEKASRLREFFTCMDDSCIMCQRARTDEGLMRWYRYEEGLWKVDEVRSLAL